MIYRHGTRILSVAMIVLGLVILGRTLVDGFGVGVLLGVLFVAAGVGRLLISRRPG